MDATAAAQQLAAELEIDFKLPTEEESKELSTLALALATKTFDEWRAAAEAKYPNFRTDPNQSAAMGAAIATAGVLCITTGLINMEPNLTLRMLALEEVIESAPTYLLAGITIERLNELMAAEATAAAPGGSVIGTEPAHPGFRD